MSLIGGYSTLSPWMTAGSGSARWCVAERGGQEFFIKQFLRPVYPSEGSVLYQKQYERCLAFEKQKKRLYASLSCVIGDTLVPVLDFFRCDRHYYAVSELVPEPRIEGDAASGLRAGERRRLLYELALCLQRLHVQGVVHADIKPDHVFLIKEPDGLRARLIDMDSGFLVDDPPAGDRDMEGDPVYLAPESFMRMAGRDAQIDTRIDTFAFGAMLHQMWVGELPAFDKTKYAYLYEAALDGARIELSRALPLAYRVLTLGMLEREARNRPADAEIVRMLYSPSREEPRAPETDEPINGMSRFMRGGVKR